MLLLVGCTNDIEKEVSQENGDIAEIAEKVLSIDDVVAVLEAEGITSEETTINEINVFQRELVEVKPQVYTLDKGTLSIYVFPSTKEPEQGEKEFEQATATASLEPYEKYVRSNVLLFYTEGSEQTAEKIKIAIEKL